MTTWSMLYSGAILISGRLWLRIVVVKDKHYLFIIIYNVFIIYQSAVSDAWEPKLIPHTHVQLFAK